MMMMMMMMMMMGETKTLTIAGLRRSDDVRCDSASLCSHRSNFIHFRQEPEEPQHCQLSRRGRCSIERCGDVRSDEMCELRVSDDESSSVQDAFNETSCSQVAMRTLRPPLHSTVCPTSSPLLALYFLRHFARLSVAEKHLVYYYLLFIIYYYYNHTT